MTETAFWQAVERFLAAWEQTAADGITWSDIGEINPIAIETYDRFAEQTSLPGVSKKDLVVRAVEAFYDRLVATRPLPWVPSFLSAFVHRQVRALIEPIVLGSIEYWVRQLPRPAPAV